MEEKDEWMEEVTRIARGIFEELYIDYGYGETSAWNEAYKRAAETIRRRERINQLNNL